MHVPKTLCKQGMQKKNCLPQFPIFLAHKNRLHLYLQFFVDIKTLEICYLFTKKMLNIELNIILNVLMEFKTLRNS